LAGLLTGGVSGNAFSFGGCQLAIQICHLELEHVRLRQQVLELGPYRRVDGVVVCAGTASRALAAQLGDRMNVYPVKGYSITIPLTDPTSQAAAPTVSLLDDATKIVTSRLGDGRFRVAGTAEFNGFNRDIRSDRIRPLVRWVETCFPGVSTRQAIPWAGLRPMMPDLMPRVCRGRAPGVFYNTGHGHLGWTLSAATAEQISALVEQTLSKAAASRTGQAAFA
jgi:D-amino-acid dehydrogenase